MTTVEQVVTPEEDVTTVDETRPETDTSDVQGVDGPTGTPLDELDNKVEDEELVEAKAEEPVEVEQPEPEPEPELFEFVATIDAPDRVFPDSLVSAFGDREQFDKWLREPIRVPKASTVITPGCERWFFNQLRDLTGLDQPRFWLLQAKVPQPLRQRIMLLDDADFIRFFNEWQKDSFGADSGE